MTNLKLEISKVLELMGTPASARPGLQKRDKMVCVGLRPRAGRHYNAAGVRAGCAYARETEEP